MRENLEESAEAGTPVGGVSYAEGPDGLRLPLIDIGHPAFRVALDDAALERMGEAFVEEQVRARGSWPRRLFDRFVLPRFLRRSLIGRGLLAAQGATLDGLTTYLLKLGPDHLDATWANELDRRIAASFPGLSLRLRLQDVAELLGAALATGLARAPDRPLWLVSLAGGAGMESLNALARLQRIAPASIAARGVRVLILDPDLRMTDFGRTALAAWSAPGGPLHGVRVELERAAYDWRDPESLDRILATIPGSALVAIASEGGLFDYADDAAVATHLRSIRARCPPETAVCGTLNSPGRAGALLNHGSRAAVRPRCLEEIRGLAATAGWVVVEARERPLNTAFRLERAGG
ncbi:hypothetical protein [Anaeromyxobacter oryzae]|uniref:Uncharacterized protein n=1 Tax=Anaeromyxobacter oryzae TaxID=2918170 RepID=A0ABM7X3Z4_9BACT|nr:hypothetical protein [Anaeromyxobacter oryzae]BDG06525.1 hypothetical protein AMOR_55210 [Anaeromyxobacter oryzae]